MIFARSFFHASAILFKTRPVNCVRRKIRPAEERFQVRRQPHAHRPAATARGRLHEGHVDVVHVGPLLAIHFDGDEILVQDFRRSPRSRTTRAPSRDTSGRSNSRSRERSVCSPCALLRTPLRPTDTNRPGYARAGEDRATSRRSVDSCPSRKCRAHLRLALPPRPRLPGRPRQTERRRRFVSG